MLRGDAKKLVIKEQIIIDDKVSGLTIMFKANKGGGWGLFITGDSLPYKNRDFGFNKDGELIGQGTGMCEECFI